MCKAHAPGQQNAAQQLVNALAAVAPPGGRDAPSRFEPIDVLVRATGHQL